MSLDITRADLQTLGFTKTHTGLTQENWTHPDFPDVALPLDATCNDYEQLLAKANRQIDPLRRLAARVVPQQSRSAVTQTGSDSATAEALSAALTSFSRSRKYASRAASDTAEAAAAVNDYRDDLIEALAEHVLNSLR